MRTVLSVLLAALLGGSLWYLFLREDDAGAPVPPPATEADEELEAHPYLAMTTGTLEVVVRAPDGSVPEGAEVGYRQGREERLRYAGPSGRRVFTDAGLGAMEVVARAPGYGEATQARELLAGVPMSVILELRPEPE